MGDEKNGNHVEETFFVKMMVLCNNIDCVFFFVCHVSLISNSHITHLTLFYLRSTYLKRITFGYPLSHGKKPMNKCSFSRQPLNTMVSVFIGKPIPVSLCYQKSSYLRELSLLTQCFGGIIMPVECFKRNSHLEKKEPLYNSLDLLHIQ